MIKKITGNFQVAAILTDSWNEPSFDAPSPKEHKTILPVFLYFCVRAAPGANVNPPPTTPFEPKFPESTSTICIDPPFPLQNPVAFPINSAIILFKSIPIPIDIACPL